MKTPNDIDLGEYFNANGYDDTLKFILESKKVPYLNGIIDISKTKELSSLSPKQKTTINYLNYLEDKKCTNVPSLFINSYNSLNDGTNGVKLTSRQVKYGKKLIAILNQKESDFYSSFIGVLKLDTDNIRLERIKGKLDSINALYIAKLGRHSIVFSEVAMALNFRGIESSEQDIIAFISLIVEISNDDNVNIPASFWESIFGRRNIKEAKHVFEHLGILVLISKAIPGFRSAGYKINLCTDSKSIDTQPPLTMFITSISTLAKLNRIIRFKGNFTLSKKIEALKAHNNLRIKEISKSKKMSLTDVFLESGSLGKLIVDLNRMNSFLNKNDTSNIALSLGLHLSTHITAIERGDFKGYRTYRNKDYN